MKSLSLRGGSFGRLARLAALCALPILAQAGTVSTIVFDTSLPVSVFTYGPNESYVNSLGLTQVTVGDITGPKLSGDLELCAYCFQETRVFNALGGPITNDGGPSLAAEIYAGGGGTGLFGTSIPVGYDFTLSSNNPDAVVSWSLVYTVYTGREASTTAIAGGSGLGNFNDSFLLDTTDFAGLEVAGWSIVLDLNWDGFEGDTLSLHIPGNSIDMPAGQAAVPEPSTYALMGAGLAGLALWRRRR